MAVQEPNAHNRLLHRGSGLVQGSCAGGGGGAPEARPSQGRGRQSVPSVRQLAH